MTRDEFIRALTEAAASLSIAYPINPSIMVAQACLESRYGESKLAKEANNLFGIKAFASWKGQKYTIETKEHINGKVVTIIADFRKYLSLLDCLEDYCKLIKTSRYYKAARENCGDYKKYAEGLKAWATDPQYTSKLIKLVDRIQLKDLKSGITMSIRNIFETN